ncbi:hypothetical protein [Helicobacter cetorum]|uniref:Uncharacterized protein n=1 Tax=Helicobacter cetorum (strain ATCC BAA-540 / CCUG 52418 / MIT 99-5656) TaxID=1163745 RepID=I0EUE8_HELCM|nr:hypothetical protein [Helicobacter cetorum]AFI06567.1 hypothetical protein HCD_07900 [Helicobacter cetorum MIT 99-5656]
MKIVFSIAGLVVAFLLGFEVRKYQVHNEMVSNNLREQNKNIEQLLTNIDRLERVLVAYKH